MYWVLPMLPATNFQFVDDDTNHPDFRLVAAFFLGWVFLSSLRYVCFSAFIRVLKSSWKGTSRRLRVRGDDSVLPMGHQCEKVAGGTYPSSFHVADPYQCQQRNPLVLLLCLTFMLGSLSSFLSLLTFRPKGSRNVCAVVVAASSVASDAARVFGLVILSLDLRRRRVRPWELCVFWSVLGLGTVLCGVNVGLGPGQVNIPAIMPQVASCIRKRFLPTSVILSILNILLELYTITRVLSLMKPPRIKLGIAQDASIVQAGSLLFFDLLVVVPTVIPANLIAEFIPYSIGALTVLAAFNSPFGPINFVPTHDPNPVQVSRRPSRIANAPEGQIDPPDHVIRISNHPFSAVSLANLEIDIEAFASRSPSSHSPQAVQSSSTSTFPSNHVRKEVATVPIVSPRPVRVAVPAMIDSDASPSAIQLESEDPVYRRRGRILSYSNPIWGTLSTSGQDIPAVPDLPQVSIEITRSPTSSVEQDEDVEISRIASYNSTVLGSDIIRGTGSRYGRDPMRVRGPRSASKILSTSSIPSFSQRWEAGQSWTSIISAYSQAGEEMTSRLTPPEESIQSKRSISLRSSKSRRRSRSRRSSGSGRSSTSIRSSKATMAERARNTSRSIRVSVTSSRHSSFPVSPVSPRRGTVGQVRGPRPPPTSPRMRHEGSQGPQGPG